MRENPLGAIIDLINRRASSQNDDICRLYEHIARINGINAHLTNQVDALQVAVAKINAERETEREEPHA